MSSVPVHSPSDSAAPAAAEKHLREVPLDGGRTLYLLGTAHVSAASVGEIRSAAARLAPDTIAIELCPARHEGMKQGAKWKETDLFRVLKERKTAFFLSQLLLQSFYRRIGRKLDVEPGADMLAGAEAAESLGARLVLADRDISVTLKRAWAALSLWEKCKMGWMLFASLFGEETAGEEEIESLKEEDAIASAVGEMARAFPAVKRVLIDERDAYLAAKLLAAPGRRILAVVGAGHVPGIVANLSRAPDPAPLETPPGRTRTGRILPWLLPAVVVALIGWSFWAKGFSRGIDSLWIWCAVNIVCSSLGGIAAFGHPLAVLAGALASPVTSLNPAIAAGWVAGIVQLWAKKPTVGDFERLPESLESLKGFWTNPVIRVLLVVVLVNLGSTLGTLFAIPFLAAH